MNKLSEEQNKVWKKLKYIPPIPPIMNLDVTTLYPHLINVVFKISKVDGTSYYEFNVAKNR